MLPSATYLRGELFSPAFSSQSTLPVARTSLGLVDNATPLSRIGLASPCRSRIVGHGFRTTTRLRAIGAAHSESFHPQVFRLLTMLAFSIGRFQPISWRASPRAYERWRRGTTWLAMLCSVLATACFRGSGEIPRLGEKPKSPSAVRPFPPSYSWARLVLDGAVMGEFVVGDPQDRYEAVRSRIERAELVVDLGYPSRGLKLRTPRLEGGTRYLLRSPEADVELRIGSDTWRLGQRGACSIVFSRVEGPGIPFFHPSEVRIFETDAGLICTRLSRKEDDESNEDQGDELNVTEGLLHFFFVFDSRAKDSDLRADRGPTAQPVSTPTTPATR